MPSAFLPLREWLAPSPVYQEVIEPMEPQQTEDVACEDEYSDVLRDVRLFRAQCREAVDRHVTALLREIAVEVVARELELAPCDLAGIVQRARERYELAEPLTVIVHPSDASRIDGDIRVVGDPLMRSGDVVLEVRGGSIDATLGVRLERVLQAFDR